MVASNGRGRSTVRRVKAILGLAADVVGLVVGLATICVAALALATAATAKFAHPEYLWLKWTSVGLGGVALGLAVGILVAASRSKRQARGYKWESASYLFTVPLPSSTIYRAKATIEIKAVRDNVHVFENRYGWSGTGTEPLPKVSDHSQVVLEPVLDVGVGWHHYFVAFRRPLSKSESCEIEILQEFDDSGHTFQPFYSKVVVEPLERLKLAVQFPPHTNLHSLTLTHLRTPGPDAKILSSVNYLPRYQAQSGLVEWSIEGRPKKGTCYRIEWKM